MKLHDIILNKKREVASYSDNQTLDAFDLEYCKLIDESEDSFIQNRKDNCIKLLEKIKSIDYVSLFRNAYEEYNEAITYRDLSQICNIINIPEQDNSTPDFKISFKKHDDDELYVIYAELKTLGFGDGNLNYFRSQASALKNKAEAEEKLKKGHKYVFTERVIDPFGVNTRENTNSSSHDFEDLYSIKYSNTKECIQRIRDKIVSNYKESQFSSGDTIMLVDLNQLWYYPRNEDCVAVEKSFNGVGFASGLLWNVAFGRETDRLYLPPEFEGKPNLENDPIGFNGVLVDCDKIKGLVFISGRTPDERSLFGFYRQKDQDMSFAYFINSVCTFYNDDRNSFGFNVTKEKCPIKDKEKLIGE